MSYSFSFTKTVTKRSWLRKRRDVLVTLPLLMSKNVSKIDLCENVEITIYPKTNPFNKSISAQLDIEMCQLYRKYNLHLYKRDQFYLSEVLITCTDLNKIRTHVSLDANRTLFLSILADLHNFYDSIEDYAELFERRKYLSAILIREDLQKGNILT